MKSIYDPEADALCLRFAEKPIVESEEVRPGMILDFDGEGRIIAIELLDASRQLSDGIDPKLLIAA